jgi:predicted DCC family thiol-disulfide oxidoreductase YuxK
MMRTRSDTTTAGATATRETGTPASEVRAPAGSPLLVIFFDGVCGLCNAWIDFVIARDSQGRFRFSPLQGTTARDWLQMTPETSLDSVTLVDAAGIHRKSEAVWRILVQLGGAWRPLGWLLRLVPYPLRNWGYDFVARRRYRWFGKKETCRLPTPAERARFLP